MHLEYIQSAGVTIDTVTMETGSDAKIWHLLTQKLSHDLIRSSDMGGSSLKLGKSSVSIERLASDHPRTISIQRSTVDQKDSSVDMRMSSVVSRKIEVPEMTLMKKVDDVNTNGRHGNVTSWNPSLVSAVKSLIILVSGASTVAIDNKIEQAMDLVKSHLMFAVREEVEVLKEQIKELLEKNSQLECENSIYKAAASPETITKVKQQQQQQQQQQQPPSSTTS